MKSSGVVAGVVVCVGLKSSGVVVAIVYLVGVKHY